MLKTRRMAPILALLAISTAYSATAGTAPSDVAFGESGVASPVSDKKGDPAEGRKIFVDRGLGNCLACHVNKDQAKELFHGTVGPPVDGAGSRWDESQLRAIVVNAKRVFGEDTVMPGFYTLEVGSNVAEKFQGKTILSAQQVEDMVAYLATLKDE